MSNAIRARLTASVAGVVFAALAASAGGAQQTDGIAGIWRLTVDRGNADRVGILEINQTDGGYEAFIDGGPAPIEVDGDQFVITMDWEDGGGLRQASMLHGGLADGKLGGPQLDEEGASEGAWSAVPEVPRVTGAPPAPVDLSGVWFDSTFDGTAKYTFAMKEDARNFQANFDPMLDDPSLRCVSDGLPRVTGGPFAMEILQPDLEPDTRLTFLYEDMHSIRRIWMDGRPFPEGVDDMYSSLGYSIGHWDGETLVIESRGFRDLIWHRSGTPISAAARITEHIYKVDPETIWIDMIVDDPTNYERPILRTTVWTAREGYDLQEYDCDPHAFYRAIQLDGRLDEYWDRAEWRR